MTSPGLNASVDRGEKMSSSSNLMVKPAFLGSCMHGADSEILRSLVMICGL